ncbi:hypothetical protein BGW38_009093 [Lunasporangiospora selenospora]|uniref:DUF221-domain-containing protein n=1 Tax=Lunasporangiospora selenospora TaxID=979761 RepID=A0A9P6FYQ5_9FUNG|nr:hypothetical protein BGW38_009093 [Lunasporangiospora selenospora]
MSDYSTRYLVPTFNGLVAQIGLSAGVTIVSVGIFEWNRRKKTLQYLYSPRCRLKVNPTPPMSLKFLGWIIPTIMIPEEFYISNVGLDAVMFLRFLRMCLHFCVFNAIFVGVILLPIHYYGGNNLSEVPRMSIANVKDNSDVLWAHVFLTYMVSISWMFLLFKNFWQWMDLRREYTLQRIRQGEIAERSIFVSRLPAHLRSDEALKHYFESLKMGPVESTAVVLHCGRLSRKIDRRESALNMLEKAHIELADEVLDSIKHGLFQVPSALGSNQQSLRQLLERSNAELVPTLQTTDASAAFEKMVQDLFQDKKRYRKVRKSIFAHKRAAYSPPPPPPQLNIPLSALSHHSDIIDIYVHGGEEAEPPGSSLSLAQPLYTIWNALASLDRQTFDQFQPTRPANRFKASGERVKSIDYFVKKYNRLDRKVNELRDGTLRYKSTSFGFVTFKHHLSAQLCAQSKIDSRPQGLSVQLAMEPRDVLWSNLTASFRNRFTRSLFVNLSTWVLIIFWIFPTSSFLLLTSLGALSAKFQFLKPIVEASPLIQSLLQNVLPIVFVNIFLALAPVLILEISKQELPVSHSALEGNVFRRYYHFLIFNILFVFMIGTAILKSIITLIQQPTNIFTLLAESLPAGSTFFIFYIVFNTCTHSLELVQIWAQLVIHGFVTARKLTPTPRSLQRATVPWCFQYYYYYPQNILAMVITFIYSVISPLILFAAIAFFGFALLVFKYQFAYCYVRKYERSGKFFRHVFQYTTDGLIIFQITMVGVLWLKQALVAGFFVIALLGFTIYFKILCGDLFNSRTKFLPLDTGLRTFDNESTCAMNEIPVSMKKKPMAPINSSLVSETSGLRKRHPEKMSKEGGYELVASDHIEVLDKPVVVASGIEYTGLYTEKPLHSTYSQDEELEAELLEDRNEVQDHSAAATPNGDVVSPVNENITSPVAFSDSTGHGLGDIVGSPPPSSESSTREIRLFTVGDDPKDGPQERDSAEEQRINGGFLDEDGFYLDSLGMRNPGMNYGTVASHFDHMPSKMHYQDTTSEFETYIHPALLKPLNRKLWLPRNPLYEHWDLDDTVEIEFALNSSATSNKLEFRVQEREEDLFFQNPHLAMGEYPPFHAQVQPQPRRGTVSSSGIEGGNSPPSNWAGCLSDSPTSTVPPIPFPGIGSVWERVDGRTSREELMAEGGSGSPAHGPSYSSASGESHRDPTSPVLSHATSPSLSHSASIKSMQLLSPASPRTGFQAMQQHNLYFPADDMGSPLTGQTRFKRSSSMPPAPQLMGDLAGVGTSCGSPLGQTATSPFLTVRSPRQTSPMSPVYASQNNVTMPGHTSPSLNQSPKVGFVHGGSGTANTHLPTRSSTLGGPISHRHTVSYGQGNSIHHPPHHLQHHPSYHHHHHQHYQHHLVQHPYHTHGPGHGSHFSTFNTNSQSPVIGAVGVNAGAATAGGASMGGVMTNTTTVTSTTPTIRRNQTARGRAGAFFNMIFGDPEEDLDVLDEDEKKARFGYETGGMWATRRGSVDHHDDDDDDEDDDDEEMGMGVGGAAPRPAFEGYERAPGGESPMGLEELQLTRTPSHLDLTESNDRGGGARGGMDKGKRVDPSADV